jgi:hypothetical protein
MERRKEKKTQRNATTRAEKELKDKMAEDAALAAGFRNAKQAAASDAKKAAISRSKKQENEYKAAREAAANAKAAADARIVQNQPNQPNYFPLNESMDAGARGVLNLLNPKTYKGEADMIRRVQEYQKNVPTLLKWKVKLVLERFKIHYDPWFESSWDRTSPTPKGTILHTITTKSVDPIYHNAVSEIHPFYYNFARWCVQNGRLLGNGVPLNNMMQVLLNPVSIRDTMTKSTNSGERISILGLKDEELMFAFQKRDLSDLDKAKASILKFEYLRRMAHLFMYTSDGKMLEVGLKMCANVFCVDIAFYDHAGCILRVKPKTAATIECWVRCAQDEKLFFIPEA